MLELHNLTAGYGQGTTLHDVTLSVATGTIHAIVGPNGAGKTTLLHTIAGLHPARAGTIHHHGQALHHQPAHRIARTGIALVPQGRRVFATLTVVEHLDLPARRRPGMWTTERLFDLLPALQPLRHRPARYLSGGEQQMLAIARALATNPALLLLDEPTEGLAPALATTIRKLIASLAFGGMTILLTAPAPDPIAHSATRLTNGRLRGLSAPEATATSDSQ